MKYQVPESEFGKQLKGPVYVMKEELVKAFGKLPMNVKITIEEI